MAWDEIMWGQQQPVGSWMNWTEWSFVGKFTKQIKQIHRRERRHFIYKLPNSFIGTCISYSEQTHSLCVREPPVCFYVCAWGRFLRRPRSHSRSRYSQRSSLLLILSTIHFKNNLSRGNTSRIHRGFNRIYKSSLCQDLIPRVRITKDHID